jgi:hypothetical protein
MTENAGVIFLKMLTNGLKKIVLLKFMYLQILYRYLHHDFCLLAARLHSKVGNGVKIKHP